MILLEKLETYAAWKGRFFLRQKDNLVVMVKDVAIEKNTIYFLLGDSQAALIKETEDSFLQQYHKLS